MLRYIRFKKSNTKALLGRWGTIATDDRDNTIQREKSIQFNSNWSNHDHCGGEICQNPQVDKDKINKKEPDEKDKKDEKEKNYYDEIKHELPHIL